jgi:hypothetical protein
VQYGQTRNASSHEDGVDDMICFNGEEHFFCVDREVFCHDYVGGANRGKYFPVVFR